MMATKPFAMLVERFVPWGAMKKWAECLGRRGGWFVLLLPAYFGQDILLPHSRILEMGIALSNDGLARPDGDK